MKNTNLFASLFVSLGLLFAAPAPFFGQNLSAVGTAPNYNVTASTPAAANAVAIYLMPTLGGAIDVEVMATRGCIGMYKAVGYLQVFIVGVWTNVYNSFAIGPTGKAIGDPGGVMLDLGNLSSSEVIAKHVLTLSSPSGSFPIGGTYRLLIPGAVASGGAAGCSIGTAVAPFTDFEIPIITIGNQQPTLVSGAIRVTPFQRIGSVTVVGGSTDFPSPGDIGFLTLPHQANFYPGVPVSFYVLDLKTGVSLVISGS